MAMQRISMMGRITQEGDGGVPWIHWVNDPGTNNIQEPFVGGEPSSVPYAVVDLSHAASIALGRQMTQSAKYRLRGFTVAFRNDDFGTNNESDTAYSGLLRWYADTEHFREALGLAREVERIAESDEVDSDSFLLSDDKDYSALRVGWSALGDVQFQTPEAISGLLAGAWTLGEIGTLYNLMTVPNESNAMFNGRFPGLQNHGWDCIVGAGFPTDGIGYSSVQHRDFHSPIMFHEVGAGVMVVNTTHSSTSDVQGADSDEHTWYFGVDFEVSV